jgi:hypothetical protein
VNQVRLLEAERSLNGVAKKVLDCVPIAESWNVGMVCTELGRKFGARYGHDVVLGCLSTLKAQGLVREPTTREFQRITAKPVLVRSTDTDTEEELVAQASTTLLQPPTQAPTTSDLIKRIGSLTASMRAVADQIDTAALELEDQLAKLSADTEKLRQLQALLKGLG